MPLDVVLLASATVQQATGVVMLKYTEQKREPPLQVRVHASGTGAPMGFSCGTSASVSLTPVLQENVDLYVMRMVDEGVEPDMDLPSLERSQRISKFQFDSLCLCKVRAGEGGAIWSALLA